MRELTVKVKQKIQQWNDSANEGILEPFRIDIYFKIGRAGNDAIAFDAILSHAVFYHVLEDDAFNLSADYDENIKLRLPLAKVNWLDTWFYNCGWIPGVPDKVTRWTKRFEKSLLQSVDSKRVSIRQGEFKSYHMPLLYDDRKHYIIRGVGVVDKIQMLLKDFNWIGKKTAAGFGQCEMEISNQVNKLYKWHNFGIVWDYQLQRPLPVENVFEYYKDAIRIEGERRMCPIHPPYFGRSVKLVECWDVGTKIIYR